MRRTAHLLLIALLLAACGGWRGGDRLMSRADSLMYVRPDAALALLDSIPEADRARMSKGQRMRYELLRADAQNKNFVKFTTDSVLKAVVSYYDSHGTPNERMRANYLLGRAYYDMGETPLALKYYHEAADCADTTQIDCDYKLLSRVHGQMGRLLLDHDALRNALDELEKAAVFSLRCKDTIAYLSLRNQKSPILDKLNYPDSAINNSLLVSKSFMSLGQDSLAANSIGNVIGVMVRQGQLKDAKAAMQLYETKSGFFDSVLNISKGKELYYYVKGNYYLASHRSDSSEYYFRKLLRTANSLNHYECAYRGLSRVYELTGRADSALKYSNLAYSYNDSSHRKKITEYYTRNQNSYNFSRQQKIADIKSDEALRAWLYWVITLLLFLTVIVLTVLYVRRNRKKTLTMQKDLDQSYLDLSRQTKEYNRLLSEKASVLARLNDMQKSEASIKDEYLKIENAYKSLANSKHIEIIEKEILISVLSAKLGKEWPSEVNDRLKELPIVQELRMKVKSNAPAMTNIQWEELKDSVNRVCTHLPVLIEEKYPDISREEHQIVYLTKAGFKSGQAMRLIETTGASAFAMKKRRLVSRLFGLDEDSAILFNSLVANFDSVK